MKHRRKVKGEQVISIEMAQQLKAKYHIVPGQLFCHQCSVRLYFRQRETHCIDDRDKVQSAADTDNEFSDCEFNEFTNTQEKAPINWHFTCQLTRIYENFKEQYFRSIQSTTSLFQNSESDSYEKNDMKEKVNEVGQVAQANARKIKTSIIFRANPNSHLGT